MLHSIHGVCCWQEAAQVIELLPGPSALYSPALSSIEQLDILIHFTELALCSQSLR